MHSECTHNYCVLSSSAVCKYVSCALNELYEDENELNEISHIQNFRQNLGFFLLNYSNLFWGSRLSDRHNVVHFSNNAVTSNNIDLPL